MDDDCDTQIDEDFLDAPFRLGQECAVGVGACRAAGHYVCAANGRGTECNAAAGSPTPEQCNGIDDDCDGLADYTVVDGQPKSACECHDEPLTVTSVAPQCGQLTSCAIPECTISNAGQEMGMSFALGECKDPYPWAQCYFDSVNLNSFDADHGASGLLAVSLCIDGLSSGETMSSIGVYYGNYPGRKRFSFFTEQELSAGVANGCYTRYFRPSDAFCPPESGIPSTCASGCPGGVWTASNRPECLFNYDTARWWLTAEFCRGTALSATISQLRVHHLTGSACVCEKNADCGDLRRPVCDKIKGVCVPS